MKKIISIILLYFLSISLVFGYNPSLDDKKRLDNVYNTLDKLFEKNPKSLISVLPKINQLKTKYKNIPKMVYLLGEIEKYIQFQDGLDFGKNVKVIDGDTIEVTVNNVVKKVRLIGIDTPETEIGEEYYGEEATKYLKSLIEGKNIYLEYDESQGEYDKYDRVLAYAFYRQMNIGNIMVEEGYAYEYTYDKAYKYQEKFRKSEKNASENRKGLWNIPEYILNDNEVEKKEIPNRSYYNPNDKLYLDMGFDCNKRKYCSYMDSCEEVKYFFYVCGAKTFDRDNDGIPCEDICGSK